MSFFQAVSAARRVPTTTSGIVTTNLYHHFDVSNSSSYSGTGTTWYDLAGNNDLTLTNGPVYNSSTPAHFDFDAVNDYATAGTWNQPSSTNFTVEAWIHMDAQTNTNRMVVTSQDSTNRAFILFNNRTGATAGTPKAMVFACWDSNNALLGANYGSVTLNTTDWYHIVAVRDGTTSYIYVNGSLDNSISLTNSTWHTGTQFDIGRRNISTVPDYFDGDISEVRFYSKGLSSTEVTQNYNATKAKHGH